MNKYYEKNREKYLKKDNQWCRNHPLKKILSVFALACVMLLTVPAASAAKPYGATIAVASDDGTNVTFAATAIKRAAIRDAGSLWVAVFCYDLAGVPVSQEYHGVDWPNGLPSGVSGPFLRTSGDCSAYVWVFPDPSTAISNTVKF